MSNGTRWTEQDMLAKGLKADARGVYKFVPHRREVIDRMIEGVSTEEVTVMKPAAMGPTQMLVQLPKKRPAGLIAIENVLRAAGIEFVNELVFSDKKGYRFDVAVPSMKLAVEYEGIFSSKNGQNGHTGVKHYIKDCDKYNLATVEGWKVLRYTAKNYKNFLSDLQQLLTNK